MLTLPMDKTPTQIPNVFILDDLTFAHHYAYASEGRVAWCPQDATQNIPSISQRRYIFARVIFAISRQLCPIEGSKILMSKLRLKLQSEDNTMPEATPGAINIKQIWLFLP